LLADAIGALSAFAAFRSTSTSRFRAKLVFHSPSSTCLSPIEAEVLQQDCYRFCKRRDASPGPARPPCDGRAVRDTLAFTSHLATPPGSPNSPDGLLCPGGSFAATPSVFTLCSPHATPAQGAAISPRSSAVCARGHAFQFRGNLITGRGKPSLDLCAPLCRPPSGLRLRAHRAGDQGGTPLPSNMVPAFNFSIVNCAYAQFAFRIHRGGPVTRRCSARPSSSRG